jgi:RNA polymerase sigma factor (sigma-70 family)
MTNAAELFQNNLPLTISMVKKYFPSVNLNTFLGEEMLAEARVGLWIAATKFNSEKGTKFSTLACTCIYNNILKYFSYTYPKQSKSYDISLNKLYEDSFYSLQENLADSFDIEEYAINNIFAQGIKEKYPTLNLHYIEDCTQKEIGERLGISQQAIFARIKKELASLKTELITA